MNKVKILFFLFISLNLSLSYAVEIARRNGKVDISKNKLTSKASTSTHSWLVLKLGKSEIKIKENSVVSWNNQVKFHSGGVHIIAAQKMTLEIGNKNLLEIEKGSEFIVHTLDSSSPKTQKTEILCVKNSGFIYQKKHKKIKLVSGDQIKIQNDVIDTFPKNINPSEIGILIKKEFDF